MFPDLFEINSLEDCSSWAGLLASAAAFTNDTNFQELLVVDPDTITVGEFLTLLDEAEASLVATDFSFLSESLPIIEDQLFTFLDPSITPDGTTVDEAVNSILEFLNDLINGNFTFITDGFSVIRTSLEGLPSDTVLCEGLTGIGGGNGGDGGGGSGIPDISNIFDFPGLPSLPNFGWIAGDPHLQTLDGVGYDFQAAGEFVLLQSAGTGDFMLQARFVPAGTNVSATEAIATNLDGVAVMVDANDATPLHIDGQAVPLNDGQSVSVGNGRVYRDADTYVVVYPGTDGEVNDGDSQLLTRIQDGRLDIDVRLNAELMGTLEGLLGDGDGNPDNDIALADGTVLDRPLTFADLYGPYRDDWRVDSLSESLFTYDTGESLESYYDANFPSELITLDTLDPDVRDAAEAAAQAAGLEPGTAPYENAVLDFALTGDESFITSALQTPLSLIGTPLADNLIGNAGSDVIDGRDGDDVITAGTGNDVITGGRSDDLLDGGGGIDTAVYSGAQNSHTLTLSSGSTTISDRRLDGDGTDTLIDIEALNFNSGSFDLTQFGGTTGLSAENFESFIELYIAYFNRAPDAIGLNFWGTAFANGTTLEEMATLFIDQDETLAAYPPGTSNSVFAETVYNNVLGRTPDQTGFDFWVDQLDSGSVSRDQFILNVLQGAKSDLKPELGQDFVDQQLADQEFLTNKTDIGAYFAVHKGMSDVDNASSAMALFDGTDVGIDAAVAAIDGHYADALDPANGEFLMQVVGVLDDPFAGV